MKRFSTLLASVVLSLSSLAHGSETKAAAKPDLAAGEAKATTVCAACHSADGSRGMPIYPILQGQHPEYLVKQLNEFKEGKRKNAIMNGMAAALSPEDMRNIAAFYASKKAKIQPFRQIENKKHFWNRNKNLARITIANDIKNEKNTNNRSCRIFRFAFV